MAYILDHNHSTAFLPRNPKLVGGYGSASYSSMMHASPSTNATPAMFASLHNQQVPARAAAGAKRTREDDDDENGYSPDEQQRGTSADAMDARGQTPDTASRARKQQPKRMRTAAAPSSSEPSTKEKQDKEPDVDVGVLLARLPAEHSRTVLMKLMLQHPELKSHVLALIPPPDLALANQALADASRKLRDSYPFQQPQASSSTSFGFGGAGTSFGFAAGPTSPMRPEYIRPRLQAPANEFISISLSYLPYFSLNPVDGRQPPSVPDTFTFLATLTAHILQHQQLTIELLSDGLHQRLMQEWYAWANEVSRCVSGGKVWGTPVVQEWADRLDAFAGHPQPLFQQDMAALRDFWVEKAGWLIGRRHHQM